MATEDQIRQLRQLINEPDDTNGWDDDKVAALVDGSETINAAASRGWYLKAGQFSTLVDVSESGSSRKLSDLRKNAQEMGALYAGMDTTGGAATTDGPVIYRIRRGFS